MMTLRTDPQYHACSRSTDVNSRRPMTKERMKIEVCVHARKLRTENRSVSNVSTLLSVEQEGWLRRQTPSQASHVVQRG